MAGKYCGNAEAVLFIRTYRDESLRIARKLDVPVEFILGLAAQESQYGSGRIARDYHNYFSMHAPAPLQVGEGEARNNPSVRLARYSSFGQAAESFAARYGASVRGVKDVHQFANALVRAGFNSGDDMSGGKTGFANYLIGIIGMVKIRMECES